LKRKETLTQKVAAAIRNELLSAKKINQGEYLPAERELAEQFKVSRVTVRLSLKQLVNSGILEVIPQKGYRLARVINAKSRGSLAYVVDTIKPGEKLDQTSEQIMSAMNRILLQKNQQMLSVGIKGVLPNTSFFENLINSNVQGIILDSNQPEVVQAAIKCNIPCVLINSYSESEQIDSIIQGNFTGSYKAVQYLLSKKHERIVWLGPTKGNPHYRERYAGARAALENVDLEFASFFSNYFIQDLQLEQENTVAFVCKQLTQKQPPTAFVGMWQPLAESVILASRKLGITLGEKIDLIGWCTESEYRENLIPMFLNENIPAMIIWSPNEMANCAIELLERRLQTPEAPFIRVEVKSRLQYPQEANKAIQTKYLI
jgi:GntR family transcriptional regulator of arabinose operon